MPLQQRLNDYVEELFSSYKPDSVRAYKVIHDSLWGTNLFHRHEIAVINTPLLQRLRQIRQTGFTFFTFPTVNHTRFEHSIGMVSVVSRFAQKLNEKLTGRTPGDLQFARISDEPSKGDLAEIRLAALLHDCGHGLFSHVSEEIYRWDKEINELKRQDEFSHAKPSELLSYFIIKSDAFKKFFSKYISDAYDVEVSLDRVADLVIGKAPPEKNFLANMINGTLDADKIDYISRDSLASGVSTPIDIDRLFNELSIFPFAGGKTALVISSILPLERLLYSKVLLFSSLYHHQKVKAADCMFHGLVEYVRESGVNFKNVSFVDPVDFLRLTDHDVLDFHGNQTRDVFVNTTISALNRRELLKRCLVIRRDTVDNYDSHVPYFVNRMGQSPWEMRRLRQEILDRLPPSKRCSVHEIWVCFPEQPSLREASQTLAILPGLSGPVRISEIFPLEGWLRAFSDNKWTGYVFGPASLQTEICTAATEVLADNGFRFNSKSAAYARLEESVSGAPPVAPVEKVERQRPERDFRTVQVDEGMQPNKGDQVVTAPQISQGPRIDDEEVLATMPLLRSFAKVEASPTLRGFRFILVLHFLEDLLGLIRAFGMAGMASENTHLLYKDYLYPSRGLISEQLKKSGFHVFPLTECETIVLQVTNECRKSGDKLLVVEDGGYVVPILHKKVVDYTSICVGAVEQTTRGVRNDRLLDNLKIPVLSVAESDIKLLNESPEVAKTVVTNIRRLLINEVFSGKKALVIGYGSVGANIAKILKDSEKMLVAVHDSDVGRKTRARMDGFDTFDTIKEALERRKFVIGATGETTIGQAEINSLENDTYLISASSDQREIGLEYLERHSEVKTTLKGVGTRYKLNANKNEVTLVADGYPVNFWGGESMPNRISDIVLTPLFLCAVELAKSSQSVPAGIQKQFVDQLIANKEVVKLFAEQQYSR